MKKPITKYQFQNSRQLPLVVIVGETASGKSQVAMDLAIKHNGEIISADSRMVYRKMDIGTAKPTAKDQAIIEHHIIDIIEPDEHFTVADYKQLTLKIIGQIRQRGKLPIMVGGTGLYIDSVVFDYKFRSQYDIKIRQNLESMTTEELFNTIKKSEITTNLKGMSRRYLISILESGINEHDDRKKLIDNVIMTGIKLTRSKLRQNIESRVEQMFKRGLRREVEELVAKYGWDHESLTGIGYREFEPYYKNHQSMASVKRMIVQHSLQYAKRQRTWFKRNSSIKWFEDADSAKEYVSGRLNILDT